MKTFLKTILVAVCMFSTVAVSAKVKLPRMVSDGMVMQRDKTINMWGWADPSEAVNVEFNGQKLSTVADDNGRWSVKLKPMKADMQSHDIKINDLIIKDVVMGDVWMFSGQSNMQTPVARAMDVYGDEIENYSNPMIREFKMNDTYNFDSPAEDISSGKWRAVTPETAQDYSIVPYFFARNLFDRYKVPIGVLMVAVGGVPVEAWLSEEDIQDNEECMKSLALLRDKDYMRRINQQQAAVNRQWQEQLRGDIGRGVFEAPDYDDSSWQTMSIPGYWAKTPIGFVNGIMWFRKEVNLTAEQAASENVELRLGNIVDADQAYINGIQVGNTSYQYPPRNYKVPAGLLKEGRNVIVVRIENNAGMGGFVPEKLYCLKTKQWNVDLSGEWKCKIGVKVERQMNIQRAAGNPDGQPEQRVTVRPIGLYNGMFSPASKFPVKGILWYHGESNADQPQHYAELLEKMVKTWRKDFGDDKLPFIMAQLHSYMELTDKPVQNGWAELRQQQLIASDKIPYSELIAGIDIGEWNDIHPLNKKPIADRFAKAASRLAYGEKAVLTPKCTSAIKKNGTIELSFTEIGKGLVCKGDKLTGFAVSDKQGNWSAAEAQLKGNKVIITTPVDAVSVRYLWKNNPRKEVSLYNSEDMPAPAFEMAIK